MTYNLAVSYDLKKGSPEDYARIASKINELGEAEKVLETIWFVKTSHNIYSAKAYLTQCIKAEDKLWVAEVLDFVSENIDYLAIAKLNEMKNKFSS